MPNFSGCARFSHMPSPSSARTTDADLLAALTAPARRDTFARDSRAFVRIDTSLRIYWHTLFDICPGLLTLSGPDGQAIFRPFMQWAEEQGVTFDWTYYLWVDAWLQQSRFCAQVTPEMRYTMMGASAARWATMDRSEKLGIVLSCSALPDLVCGWKMATMEGGREIEQIELESPLPAPSAPFGYFLVDGRGLEEDFPGWQGINK